MGLAIRIIPALLVKGRQLLKGERFNAWRSVGHAMQAARIHGARAVDELVILDITATAEGRGPDLKMVEELSKDLFCPLSVGGGVRTVDDVRNLLHAGSDKVVIGTQGVEQSGPNGLVFQASQIVGCQAIVVAIDVKDGYVWSRSGTRKLGNEEDCCGIPSLAAISANADGAGEILLTSIEREGTMQGYDLELIRKVSEAVDIPVVAHGGCGSYEHMRQAIEAGADAVAAGAMFQFTEATPRGAAEYLAQHGVETRVPA